MKLIRILGVGATLLALLALTPAPGASANSGTTERVSVDSVGEQGNSNSYHPAISADGHYVAFTSHASNLVPDDTNETYDVFIHRRQTATTERASVDSAGNQGNNGSHHPAISGGGCYVAFDSDASDLVDEDTNGVRDVFVRDRQTDSTERVSVDSVGNQGNDDSYHPAISADDGHYVAFASDATNLVDDDTNGAWDIFVHNRQTGSTERVSVDSAGKEANGHSQFPTISADGRYVAFESNATNLVDEDTNGTWDVFVHDRYTDVTTRVSVHSTGEQGNNQSGLAAISAYGRYVAFASDATNLVDDDTNGALDVFVHDRKTASTERVSVDSAGNQGNDDSYHPAISADDGHYVAFASDATNLVDDDTNGASDIFVHNRQTGSTERVSVDSAGEQGDNHSGSAAISADGRYVAFESAASNLVLNDTNSVLDVFVHDRGEEEPTPTPTPTLTPTPISVAVGGIAELPEVSDPSARNYMPLAGLAVAALVTIAAGAWYAGRRWLR